MKLKLVGVRTGSLPKEVHEMELAAGYALRKPSVVIQPRKGLFQLDLRSVWQYRELLYFLVWRDVIVRYKQTAIGAAWAILQPLITMLIFTLIFGRLAKIPSDGIPYPVFAFAALLPWSYFAQALTRSSNSVVGSSNLVTKIYFPRLLIPLSASVAPVVDLFFSFLVLLGLMAWFKTSPTWGLLALPLFLGLAIMTALAVGLWSSALNVRYRDVGHIVPFLSQVWMYASPVAYPISMVPEKWRLLYSLNPMVGVIEGFRWALLGKEHPDFMAMAVSSAVVFVLLVGGIVYFKRMERTFADII
jgi:lipopolysaccharide transport system permease protein